MISLENKIALVTRGSRGIGKACVEYLVKAGASVAFTFNINEDLAKKLCNELRKLNKVKAYRADVHDEDNVQAVVNEVLKDFGGIDILVNNAGIWKQSKIAEMSLSDWKETINTNLTGAFLFIKYTVPIMKGKGFGRIINITSTAGQRGEEEYSHYAASKGGVAALTKSLAVELGKFNITVNDVAPGWVKTDMTNEKFSDLEEEQRIIVEIPLRKVAKPEDIAGSVVFLASDLASHITGSTISVNGGSVR